MGHMHEGVAGSAGQASAERQFPGWLNAFTLDKPWKKAAWCGSHRELLTDSEAFLASTVILWGSVAPTSTVGLERLFARLLWVLHKIRWGEHPLCDPVTKGIVISELATTDHE